MIWLIGLVAYAVAIFHRASLGVVCATRHGEQRVAGCQPEEAALQRRGPTGPDHLVRDDRSRAASPQDRIEAARTQLALVEVGEPRGKVVLEDRRGRLAGEASASDIEQRRVLVESHRQRGHRVDPVPVDLEDLRGRRVPAADEVVIQGGQLLPPVDDPVGHGRPHTSPADEDLWQRLGPDGTTSHFLHLAPGQHPQYPQGSQDNTHFQALGALAVARLVARELEAEFPYRVRTITLRAKAVQCGNPERRSEIPVRPSTRAPLL